MEFICQKMRRIPHSASCNSIVAVVVVFMMMIVLVCSEAAAAAAAAANNGDNALLLLQTQKRRLHGTPATAVQHSWKGPFSGTNVIQQHQHSLQQQQHTPLLLTETTTTSARSSRTLLKIRGGGGCGGDASATAMRVAIVSATAVSLIHGLIDIIFPAAVCRYYAVPPATSMPGMEEILIRRIGTLLFATGLVAFTVFIPKNIMSAVPFLNQILQLQTLDQAVALATLVFWLESLYILVKKLPSKVEFDATATWTNLFVNTAFLSFYSSAFKCHGLTATVLVTKWIIRIVLVHGILGIVAPSAVLALGGFPPPRKNQDLAVVLGVTRAAGYWGLAFAIFAMSVQNAVVHDNNNNNLTLYHLRGFAYSRLVILFRSVYMNFASREVYTSLRLKQVFWLVFDFLVAVVLSQSFFWKQPIPASIATIAQDTLFTVGSV